ncbi:MAG: tyrosine-type recombinase/integrase [Candidatus Aenigmarchaeota archaeon]|nr:tyrosine-type recombinase/integrase [Candidatus Aenigmarchaeota archaeon]NIP40726.1 tyrosine-type recombinase/integrase [Candidatus Aenigmarchaeota archaeon]NIQ18532.1 tyrosine-type recombinase/integrase [Candidatus Aenigmarchaeota archaeon]NIS73431.1 tyrosine-type recombinase/integrase [Candidatus Aenigmarchaeota archaeon]
MTKNRGSVENKLKELLSDRTITDRNRDHILKFKDNCVAEVMGNNRIHKYLTYLPKIARILKKDFKKAEKEDIQRVLAELEKNQSYSAWTKYDFRVMIKRFYKWLEGDDEVYPKKVRWIKSWAVVKKARGVLPDELLTVEEIKAMIENCYNIRDKAIISVLYESGFRVSEFLGMRIKHVDFSGDLAHITFEIEGAKTGMRKIPLINSIPYLANWIGNHPSQNDPNSYVWISNGHVNHNQPMCYGNLMDLLRKIAVRAGVKKRVNPHNFRHSKATEMAKSLTEYQLCLYFGWKKSATASTYVHLAGRDLDIAIRELAGLSTPEQKKNELEPIKCPRCEKTNEPTAKMCNRCGLILSAKNAMQTMFWRGKELNTPPS